MLVFFKSKILNFNKFGVEKNHFHIYKILFDDLSKKKFNLNDITEAFNLLRGGGKIRLEDQKNLIIEFKNKSKTEKEFKNLFKKIFQDLSKSSKIFLKEQDELLNASVDPIIMFRKTVIPRLQSSLDGIKKAAAQEKIHGNRNIIVTLKKKINSAIQFINNNSLAEISSKYGVN